MEKHLDAAAVNLRETKNSCFREASDLFWGKNYIMCAKQVGNVARKSSDVGVKNRISTVYSGAGLWRGGSDSTSTASSQQSSVGFRSERGESDMLTSHYLLKHPGRRDYVSPQTGGMLMHRDTVSPSMI